MQKEQHVEGLLKNRVRFVILFAKAVELIEEPVHLLLNILNSQGR